MRENFYVIILVYENNSRTKKTIHHIHSPGPAKLLWSYRMGRMRQEADAAD